MATLSRLVALLLLLLGGVAAAGTVPHLRVIVPRAAVRTGPTAFHRELYRAQRDEVFEVVDRNGAYWFRVILPDGRFGWVYGEQVMPFEVNIEGSAASKAWAKVKEALFAPSPIPSASVGLTFSGGALGGEGMFMFRPAVTLDAHFAIEAHIGEAVGRDGALLLYGIGGNIISWPLGPFVPFLSLGVGGATSFPKVNGVTQESKSQWAVDAGAGAAFVFKKRLILRFDFRNYTLFTPDASENRQEYSGGLAVFF
jgi:hypothetical protein